MKRFIKNYDWERALFFVSAVLIFCQHNYVRDLSYQMAQFEGFFPLSFVKTMGPSTFYYLYLSTFNAFVILACLRWHFPWVGLLLWSIFVAQTNSFGAISNSRFCAVYVYMALVVMDLLKNKNSLQRLQLVAVATTFTYAASGLWKCRNLFTEHVPVLVNLKRSLPYSISIGILEGYDNWGVAALGWMHSHPWLSSFLWVSTILFQILVPLAIIYKPQWISVCLFMCFLFHFMVQKIVGPIFFTQQYLMLFLAASALLLFNFNKHKEQPYV